MKITRRSGTLAALGFALLGCGGGGGTSVVVPTVSTPPASQSVVAGGSVTFSVKAKGGSLTYQWTKDGVSLSGAISSSYTIDPVSIGDAGDYAVVVTNAAGTVTSDPATLTVDLGVTVD